MANKSAKTSKLTAKPSPLETSLTSRGKKVIAAGVFLVALGLWILTYTDPGGQNWASTLSPLLLVVGYGLIGLGLVVKDPPPAEITKN